MNSSFRMFPEAASSSATEVDYLSLTLLGITTLFSFGIALAIVVFITRYWHTRTVNRVSSHSNLLHWIVELTWSIGPLMILLVMFAWRASVYVRAHQPPDNSTQIHVVAKQWMWKIAHEGGRREINELHVPTGRPVRLTMISEDVIHSFFVPAFRIKQDVLPGRYSTMWFEATKPGTYHLFCAEYCGTDHSRMKGTVTVHTPEQYAKWLEDENTESLAQRGRRLTESMGCLQCHARPGRRSRQTFEEPLEDIEILPSSGTAQIGPLLTGLYGRNVVLGDGSVVVADDAYIRHSILDPQAQHRAGFTATMPSFDGQLNPEQITEITAYIRSIADATGPLAGPGIETQIESGETSNESP